MADIRETSFCGCGAGIGGFNKSKRISKKSIQIFKNIKIRFTYNKNLPFRLLVDENAWSRALLLNSFWLNAWAINLNF